MSQLIESQKEFRALSGGGMSSDLLTANLGGESLRSSDLTWVKVPTGGSTTWSWDDATGDNLTMKAIEGLLVVVGPVETVLWPNVDALPGSRPLLTSDDGKIAYRTGMDYGDLDRNVIEGAKNQDGSYRVEDLPYFQWEGRGPGSRPPRAKSSRVLGILMEEEHMPIFLRVSQTSLTAVDAFLRGITTKGLYHWQTVVELTLERRKGARADYASLVCRKIGVISEELGRTAEAKVTAAMTPVVCPSAKSRSGNSPAVVVQEVVPF